MSRVRWTQGAPRAPGTALEEFLRERFPHGDDAPHPLSKDFTIEDIEATWNAALRSAAKLCEDRQDRAEIEKLLSSRE